MTRLKKLLAEYDYLLPPNLIAQKPTSPRDSARLLIYSKKTKKLKYDTFTNIGNYLPKNAVLVFNQTKVVPARLSVQKTTGGKADLLYLNHNNNTISALCNKNLTINTFITIPKTKYNFKVLQKIKGEYKLLPNFSLKLIPLILNKHGKTPLPPYIKHSPLNEKQKRSEYQSVFAKTGESVAAPTAALHFTKNLIKRLQKLGITTEYICLNVGMGTFAPLNEDHIKNNKLHSEYFSIEPKTLNRFNKYKQEQRPIFAVGTTTVRTLESSATQKNMLKITSGFTEIFIKPGYKFKFINGLITNFHVPKSSLLMLVSALVGKNEVFKIYKKAVLKKFRFFSFGDGMLILP